jgi:hypothetical protein
MPQLVMRVSGYSEHLLSYWHVQIRPTEHKGNITDRGGQGPLQTEMFLSPVHSLTPSDLEKLDGRFSWQVVLIGRTSQTK